MNLGCWPSPGCKDDRDKEKRLDDAAGDVVSPLFTDGRCRHADRVEEADPDVGDPVNSGLEDE